MERNEAAARHSWAGQHAWLLLNLFPFPVGQTIYAHCTYEPHQWLLSKVERNRETKRALPNFWLNHFLDRHRGNMPDIKILDIDHAGWIETRLRPRTDRVMQSFHPSIHPSTDPLESLERNRTPFGHISPLFSHSSSHSGFHHLRAKIRPDRSARLEKQSGKRKGSGSQDFVDQLG